jgi:hypothetical protein
MGDVSRPKHENTDQVSEFDVVCVTDDNQYLLELRNIDEQQLDSKIWYLFHGIRFKRTQQQESFHGKNPILISWPAQEKA